MGGGGSGCTGCTNWDIQTSWIMSEELLYVEALIPPDNFAMVCKGVYRSAFPTKKNFPFLERLKLKSVL